MIGYRHDKLLSYLVFDAHLITNLIVYFLTRTNLIVVYYVIMYLGRTKNNSIMILIR